METWLVPVGLVSIFLLGRHLFKRYRRRWSGWLNTASGEPDYVERVYDTPTSNFGVSLMVAATGGFTLWSISVLFGVAIRDLLIIIGVWVAMVVIGVNLLRS